MTLLFILLCSLCVYVLLRQYAVSLGSFLSMALAVVLSHGLLSFTYAIFLFTKIPFLIVSGIFSLLLLTGLIYKRKSVLLLLKTGEKRKTPLFVTGIFLICLYAFTADFLKISQLWGVWDAWAIWSLHAKFLMNSNSFGQLFSASLSWSHPDYPLMLPSWIAAYWKLTGSINPEVPLVIAWLTGVAALVICYLHFLQKEQAFFGLLCVSLLCGQNMLLPVVTFQYADAVLGLFLLLSFVLLEHFRESEHKILAVCLGFSVACCGWIKNEGLAFILIFSLLFLINYFSKRKLCLYYLLGAMMPMTFIVYFKIQYAPSGDLFQEGNAVLAERIKDPERYLVIWQFVKDYLTQNSSLLLYVLLATLIFQRRYYFSFPFLAIAGLFCSYLAIYIITPNNLEWHLASSFDRLLHQLMPATIFTIIAALGRKYKVTISSNP